MEISEVMIHKVDAKKLAKSSGLSLRKWAEKAGVSYVYFIRCVNGKHTMKTETWRKLAKVLDEYNQYNS